MELRYDPASDTTEYIETFRATCPACGTEQKAVVFAPGVPRDEIEPSVHAALDTLMADRLARVRALWLADPPPCRQCSPRA